jgi:hypothetical protein
MLKAIGSGLVGAVALTLVHETARRFIEDAPRVDVIGMRALAKALRAADAELPPDIGLHEAALIGDLVSNSAYYSLVAAGGRDVALRNGALLGLAAGLGAVFLPQPLGLGRQPTENTPSTELMTVAWYLIGGLAAGATYRALSAADD